MSRLVLGTDDGLYALDIVKVKLFLNLFRKYLELFGILSNFVRSPWNLSGLIGIFRNLFFDFKDEILQITDKRIYAISLLPGHESHGTFAVISGSKRVVRVVTYYSNAALGVEPFQPTKIDDTRQAMQIDSKLCRFVL